VTWVNFFTNLGQLARNDCSNDDDEYCSYDEEYSSYDEEYNSNDELMDESEEGIAIDASNQQNCFLGENATDDNMYTLFDVVNYALILYPIQSSW
jgi:hypothetical protein